MSTDAPCSTLQLPDDATTLKALVAQQYETISQLQRQVEGLSHRLDLALRRIYGRSSEKIDPKQLLLFGQMMATAAQAMEALADAQQADKAAAEARMPVKRGHGRRPLPADLARHRIEHQLDPAELTCPCCSKPRVKIGEDVSEQLDYTPASLFVIQHPRGCGPSSPAASAKTAGLPRPKGPTPCGGQSTKACPVRAWWPT